MLRSLGDLRNYRIQAIDGHIGAVHDLLFDDVRWTVRYFVVDTGSWLPGRKVLISPASVGRADWAMRQVRVVLTRDQIKDAPGVDTDQSVSRQQEEMLARHYAWPIYWAMPAPEAAPPPSRPDLVEEQREARSGSSGSDSHLRSLREVVGYRIETRDGSIGHLEDFIAEDSNWAVRYAVVDTRDWLPGKRVLVSPAWIESVDWSQAHVKLDLDREQVREAPAYDPATPIDREYEKRLYEHYGRPGYWSGASAEGRQ